MKAFWNHRKRLLLSRDKDKTRFGRQEGQEIGTPGRGTRRVKNINGKSIVYLGCCIRLLGKILELEVGM